jgi:uncharacterized membrane protein
MEPTRGGAFVRRWAVVRDAFRTQLWPLPTAAIVVALLLGVGLPRLDALLHEGGLAQHSSYLFDGGPESARSVLVAIAGSLITVTALTFSITVLTLQLASSQFSPRLLRTFTSDRVVQGTLALFLGTFVYSLTVLRSVRSPAAGQVGFVPQASVTLAFALTVISVLALVGFIAHVVREIRVDSMLRNVHDEASRTLGASMPDEDGAEHPTAIERPPGAAHVTADRSGFVTAVDDPALLAVAKRVDACLAIDRRLGESVIAGTPLGDAWSISGTEELGEERLSELQGAVDSAITIGFERTAAHDIAFGLRQLTDVAVKSLSPGINDPTTAIHALSHSSALLCEAAAVNPGPLRLRDEQGRIRVVVAEPTMADLLDLAVSQPRRYGAGDPAVLNRLFGLLAEVAWSSDLPQHRQAVADQLGRLRGTVAAQDFDEAEHALLAEAGSRVEDCLHGRWTP